MARTLRFRLLGGYSLAGRFKLPCSWVVGLEFENHDVKIIKA
jgi:hypothetical protein